MKYYTIGQKVFIKYGNYGYAVIISKGRKAMFGEWKLYKVKIESTQQVSIFNELHFDQ